MKHYIADFAYETSAGEHGVDFPLAFIARDMDSARKRVDYFLKHWYDDPSSIDEGSPDRRSPIRLEFIDRIGNTIEGVVGVMMPVFVK